MPGGNIFEVLKVKKKSKVIGKKRAPAKPEPVGGRNANSGTINWSKVGRKRKIPDEAILELARTLKTIREKKGIPLSKLAKELKVAPATLIKFEERGHAISVGVVSALAGKLDCALEVQSSSKSRKSKR